MIGIAMIFLTLKFSREFLKVKLIKFVYECLEKDRLLGKTSCMEM